jgi:hypothetical protein
LKFIEIMTLRGQMGPQIGKAFFHKLILEKIFSKTSRPITIKLDANYPCLKGI